MDNINLINQMEFEEASKEKRLYSIIESLLYVSGEPLNIDEIARITGCNFQATKAILDQMSENYKSLDRGIKLINMNDKYCLSTKPENSIYVEKLLGNPSRQQLSQAALETLAIIAYKQPVTRVVIDEIRGVKSEKAITSLLEKKLIKESGRLDAPGKPILYTTSEEFLKYFGLESLNELPGIDSFTSEF